MEQRRLKKEYKEYVFIKAELEECLTFALDRESDSLPDYLKPYKTRVGILLTEAANILAGFRPNELINKSPGVDVVLGFKDSLWDAVDNSVLSGKNELTDYNFNQKYRTDITLVKDEVTLWAKKHEFNWPFQVSNSESRVIKENSDNTIIGLSAENESLKKELMEIKDKVPSLLGRYRSDDPLLLAIKLRNEEWINYNEDDRASTPTVEYLVEKLKEQYGKENMSDALARAIEKVACPTQRK